MDLAGVAIPPYALASSMTVTVGPFTIRTPLEEALKQRKSDAQGLVSVSTSVVVGPDGTQLAASVSVSVPYDPEEALAQGVSETELQVFWWDPDRQAWQWQPSSVDMFHHVVSAQVRHFSLFQVFGRKPKR